ncbi:MAG: class III signal peptide-containing protein [Elusimicrobia bacterium]|nr:class III signal peptide-containing protein [Elusimicrobiota bacterium]
MISYAYLVLNMKANELLRNRKGQNTVEYLLMLAVVVGVVLIAGIALKSYMPTLFDDIQRMISGAAGSLGAGSGNR